MIKEIANPGEIFVCSCCGRRSYDLYGEKRMDVDATWSKNCMLTAVLCKESHIELDEDGLVVLMRHGGILQQSLSNEFNYRNGTNKEKQMWNTLKMDCAKAAEKSDGEKSENNPCPSK